MEFFDGFFFFISCSIFVLRILLVEWQLKQMIITLGSEYPSASKQVHWGHVFDYCYTQSHRQYLGH